MSLAVQSGIAGRQRIKEFFLGRYGRPNQPNVKPKRRKYVTMLSPLSYVSFLVGFPRETFVLSFWQAILLSIVYVMFALWRLVDTLNDDVGGKTLAAQLMLLVRARQVPTAAPCAVLSASVVYIDGFCDISRCIHVFVVELAPTEVKQSKGLAKTMTYYNHICHCLWGLGGTVKGLRGEREGVEVSNGRETLTGKCPWSAALVSL